MPPAISTLAMVSELNRAPMASAVARSEPASAEAFIPDEVAMMTMTYQAVAIMTEMIT